MGMPRAVAATATDRFSGSPTLPLDLDWIESVRINRSAVERRAATLARRRSVKREWQVGWLMRAVTLLDLTTLSGDDTSGRVARLAAKARCPVRRDILEDLGYDPAFVRVAAVCVYHAMVPAARMYLSSTGIPVAAGAAGFPHGLSPFRQRVREIERSVAAGAKEIDIVITRSHVLTSNWRTLYEEVQAFREAAASSHLKVILATGELGTLTKVARASLVCMMAGADFIKTSTGKELVNATLPVGLVMTRQIRAFQERTGRAVGFKPAGGISKAKEVIAWMILMREELGEAWLRPELLRIGASSLLADIERQLEHHVTGRYSAFNRHPLS